MLALYHGAVRGPALRAWRKERGERDAARVAHPCRSAAVMKIVAERDNEMRCVALDESCQPRQRRGCIVRRQQHAAGGEGRTFFEMQVGDDEQLFIRPINRARRIGDERDAGKGERVLVGSSPRQGRPSSRIPADAGMSGKRACSHCMASFTNSASVSASSASAASP